VNVTAKEKCTRDAVVDMPVERLEAEVRTLAERLAVSTYDLLVLVGELDARGTWAAWGYVTCAAWLADVCDVEAGTARTQLRVARALREFGALDEAMRAGDVSYAKARVLTPYLTEASAAELVAIAVDTPAGRLRIAIARWLQRREDAAETDRRHQRDRSVSWRTDPDGMVTITARLAPADAAAATAVIDQHVMRTTDAPAGASLAQQRADALMAAFSDGGGDIMTEVVVHVRPDGNTLSDGTPISDHAVAGLLPDAFVSLLIHDTHGRPIDASPRRRTPTRRQRRVIDERDPTCRHPGCGARHFLQYDHLARRADGGATVLDNLWRLCGPHNRAREEHPS
jgi:hypothetical protein